jgi:hypothetical protein
MEPIATWCELIAVIGAFLCLPLVTTLPSPPAVIALPQGL